MGAAGEGVTDPAWVGWVERGGRGRMLLAVGLLQHQHEQQRGCGVGGGGPCAPRGPPHPPHPSPPPPPPTPGVLFDAAAVQPPLSLTVSLGAPGPRATPRLWAALLEELACMEPRVGAAV